MFERQQGVRIPPGQRQEQGTAEPKTVLQTVPAQMVAVQYADENGDLHNTVLLRVGKSVYHTPNGEEWASRLKPAAGWLADHVISEVDSESVPLPTEDKVDVMPQDSVTMAVQSGIKEIDAQDQETPE